MRMQALPLLAVLLAWSALTALPGHARAETRVRVVETWPAGQPLTLAPNQALYLRLAYDTDAPVHIWARPFFHGAPADAASHPSRVYSGSGEAFGWFSLSRAGVQVDEVQITAGDGSTAGTRLVATLPLRLTTDAGASAEAEPAWVARMREAERAAQRADQARAMQDGSTPGVALFGMVFMLATGTLCLLGFLAPAWGLLRWRGPWRVAAAAPAVLMAFVVLRIVADGLRDPTSHNLWPFEVLTAGIASVIAIGVLAVLRRVVAGTVDMLRSRG
jgi:hypothetical protein